MDIVIAVIAGLIVGVLIGWYLWARRANEYQNQVAEMRSSVSSKERNAKNLQARINEHEATIERLRSQLEPDDLTKIEGIGPKIQGVLHVKGVYTFKQLAAVPVNQLEQFLSEADLPLADPATWPEQAALAAAGDWARFEALQNELKAGRRAPSVTPQ